MPKHLSPTEELAIWFIENILGERFDYRYQSHRYQLKAAKDLVNPDPDPITGETPIAYSVEEIKGYILALRDGATETTDYLPFEEWAGRNGLSESHNIKSLRILTSVVRGKGRTFLALLSDVPGCPPVYEGQEFADWVRKYGLRAYQQGKWDGIFRWFPDETPAVCSRMSMDEFESLMGSEFAFRSIEEWNRLRERGRPG